METSESVRALSFSEAVTGREAAVRLTHDGLLYAVDLAMVMTGKDRNQAGQVIRDLDPRLFLPEKFIQRQISSRGGPKTKLVNFNDAIKLIMVLPGNTAKQTRAQFASIIQRYMAGDQSLVTEVQANKASSSIINQLAKESLDSMDNDSTPECGPGEKRKRHGVDTHPQQDYCLLEKQMQFVQEAFDYQKEILELQHEHATSSISDGEHVFESVHDMLWHITRKNTSLKREDTEASQCIRELEANLETLRSEQKALKEKIAGLIEPIRILSCLHLELDEPTEYMKQISGLH
jgi:FtsZ-binding cell division protein ZapB